jgi:hypothetical protein
MIQWLFYPHVQQAVLTDYQKDLPITHGILQMTLQIQRKFISASYKLLFQCTIEAA